MNENEVDLTESINVVLSPDQFNTLVVNQQLTFVLIATVFGALLMITFWIAWGSRK